MTDKWDLGGGQSRDVTDHAFGRPDVAQGSTDRADTRDWVAIWTASRAEKRVAARIDAAGVEVWLPTVVKRSRWSDRWRDVVVPLFPGYLFARVSSCEWPSLIGISGVLTLVKSGDRPARLSDPAIASLRAAVESRAVEVEAVSAFPTASVGDEVRVLEGPLAGLRGIVEETRSGRWLVVWVPQIGRGARFTIGSALVAVETERRLRHSA